MNFPKSQSISRLIFISLFVLSSFKSFAQFNKEDSLKLLLPSGHFSESNASNFSSDGRFMISISNDNVAQIWDTYSFKQIHNLSSHEKKINSAKFGRNNQLIITASDDKTAKIWDLTSGNLLHTLDKHIAEVKYAELSADEKLAITAAEDGTAIVWDTKSGKEIFVLQGHQSAFLKKAMFSPDTKYVLTQNEEDVCIWSLTDGKLLKNLKEHNDDIVSVTISSDGKKILTSSMDKKAIIWSLEQAKLLVRLEGIHTKPLRTAIFSPDDKYVLTLGWDNFAVLWDSEKGKQIKVLEGHSQGILSAAFSPDSKQIITASQDKTLCIWNAYSGALLNKLKDLSEIVSFVCYSPNGKLILTSSFDRSSRILSAKNGKDIKFISSQISNIKKLKISPNGKIAISLDDYSANVFNLETGNKMYSFYEQSSGIDEISISPDSKTVISISSNNELKVWELETGRTISELKGHKQQIEAVGFSSDSKYAISCSSDSSLRIWDFHSGELKNIYEHNNVVKSFTVSPNGKFIVTKSKDKTIRVIDLSTEKTLKYFYGNAGYYLVDNERLFLKSNDNSVTAIEIFSEKILYKTNAHNDLINHIALSSCGNFALSTSDDKTVRVWEVKSGTEILILEHQDAKVEFAEFSPDLKYILTHSNYDSYLWDFKSGKKIRTHQGQNAVFCHNSRYYLSYDLNNKFSIWDYKSGIAIYEKILLLNDNWLVKIPSSKYYMCSKDASKMLHYVTPELRIIGFDQLDPIYNRPDMILEHINKFLNSNDTNLIKQYKAAWTKRINILGLDNMLISSGKIAFPKAEIENSDQIESLTEDGNLQITIKASDPENVLMRFNVMLNEVPYFGSNGISLAYHNTKNWDTTLTIPLSLGENKLQVSVINQLGLENFKFPTYIKYENENIKPKTIFIGIGVDQFKDTKYNLNYSVKDIEDLSSTLEDIPNFEQKILLNKDVTKENVLSLKKYLNNTSVHDKVIVSCSSHGLIDNSNFYLATSDTDFDNPNTKGISYNELENLLDGIPARKKLLLIDACNSGEFDKENSVEVNDMIAATDRPGKTKGKTYKKRETVTKSNFSVMKELFINTSNNTGSYIISATTGIQNALEGVQTDSKNAIIKNGAFTHSIIEYINAHKNSTDKLTVNLLKKYVEKRVVELTNGEQKPTSRQETMEIDWNLW